MDIIYFMWIFLYSYVLLLEWHYASHNADCLLKTSIFL